MPMRVSHGVNFPGPMQGGEDGGRKGGGDDRWEASVLAMSKQKNGSQFLQTKIEQGRGEDREAIFRELMHTAAIDVVMDQFGNYVIQRLLRKGTPHQVKGLSRVIIKHAHSLSVHMYGCRVLQCALDVVTPDDKRQIVIELSNDILGIVQDQHGNHVVQKCVRVLPEATDVIAAKLQGRLVPISKHIYGCRIVERILEEYQQRGDGGNERVAHIMAELFTNVEGLIEDRFGNYVVQYILRTAHERYTSILVANVKAHLLRYSLHKFASNVVEKCFDVVRPEEKTTMLRMLVAPQVVPAAPHHRSVLLMMVGDQYGNYVVQKMIEKSDHSMLSLIIQHLYLNPPDLLRATYGKVVLQKLAKVCDDRGLELPKELHAVTLPHPGMLRREQPGWVPIAHPTPPRHHQQHQQQHKGGRVAPHAGVTMPQALYLQQGMQAGYQHAAAAGWQHGVPMTMQGVHLVPAASTPEQQQQRPPAVVQDQHQPSPVQSTPSPPSLLHAQMPSLLNGESTEREDVIGTPGAAVRGPSSDLPPLIPPEVDRVAATPPSQRGTTSPPAMTLASSRADSDIASVFTAIDWTFDVPNGRDWESKPLSLPSQSQTSSPAPMARPADVSGSVGGSQQGSRPGSSLSQTGQAAGAEGCLGDRGWDVATRIVSSDGWIFVHGCVLSVASCTAGDLASQIKAHLAANPPPDAPHPAPTRVFVLDQNATRVLPDSCRLDASGFAVLVGNSLTKYLPSFGGDGADAMGSALRN